MRVGADQGCWPHRMWASVHAPSLPEHAYLTHKPPSAAMQAQRERRVTRVRVTEPRCARAFLLHVD